MSGCNASLIQVIIQYLVTSLIQGLAVSFRYAGVSYKGGNSAMNRICFSFAFSLP